MEAAEALQKFYRLWKDVYPKPPLSDEAAKTDVENEDRESAENEEPQPPPVFIHLKEPRLFTAGRRPFRGIAAFTGAED